MTQRSNIVRLRLTDLEKADWQKAAGGERKLSEWIRGVCNAECDATREPVPNQKPKIVQDAIRAEAEGRATPASAERGRGNTSEPSQRPPAPSTEQCPRWMHHKKGVYCGACKRVIK